jgi:hypothetical protein
MMPVPMFPINEQRGYMKSSDSERKINLKAAAKHLGVSHRKMGQLLKEGALEYSVDPLDHRQKLVSIKAVELLKLSSDSSVLKGGKGR